MKLDNRASMAFLISGIMCSPYHNRSDKETNCLSEGAFHFLSNIQERFWGQGDFQKMGKFSVSLRNIQHSFTGTNSLYFMEYRAKCFYIAQNNSFSPLVCLVLDVEDTRKYMGHVFIYLFIGLREKTKTDMNCEQCTECKIFVNSLN